MKLKNKIDAFFSKGHERSVKAKKNIAIAFLLKGFTVLIGLILIPLTIKYVNPTQYGIWLTLSSVIGWFSFFDIGLGNGLKNKLAETSALGENSLAKIYVSTTYAILTIISIIVFLLFLFANHFISWDKILNTHDQSNNNLNTIALLLVGLFCIQFIVQIINTILTACHQVSKVSLIFFIGQLFSLIVIYILTKNTSGSLFYLVFPLAGIPLLIQIGASVYYYRSTFKIYAPAIKSINFKYAKDLLTLGGAFFFIQIGALILFQTDNIIITQIFDPKQVTVFNVAFKLFSVISMVFTIIMTPFWSAFTDAYTKGDLDWIRSVLNKMKKLWLLLSLASILLIIISPLVYKVWLHDSSVHVPFFLSFAMGLYMIGFTWMMLHCYLLNGIGKIRIQLYMYLFSIFINVPLAIFFGKLLGVAGVTLSNFLIFIVMGILVWLQCRRILNGTAKGVWNK